MDRLPAELWMYICSLACTDGGRTGRSLALVSRCINALSKPCRLQYLSLTTPRQIHLLADLLESSGYTCSPVKSLFICCSDLSLDYDNDDDSDYCDGVSSTSSDPEGEELEGWRMDVSSDSGNDESDDDGRALSAEELSQLTQELTELTAEDEDDDTAMDLNEGAPSGRLRRSSSLLDLATHKKDEEALDDLFRLLTIVSPTLTILSIHWTSLEGYLLEDMVPPLPNLQEFCIFRSITGEDEVEPQTNEAAPNLFPTLRRLHLGGYVDERPGSYFKYVSELTPSLTNFGARC
ncbi:hypothetical protein NMY22_g16342 [Coprinellus aureogranulatus]|nr:hypothetical protein NMY22_g16342 [Coprinellus aureogranulatus]